MFSINNHILAGKSLKSLATVADVVQSPSPNHNGEILPRFLVFHYTACDAQTAKVAFLKSSGSDRVSVHLLVDSDGSVTQFVPLNIRAWHAGES
jgi:N-acetylmuramoyl-L-alanine amidase